VNARPQVRIYNLIQEKSEMLRAFLKKSEKYSLFGSPS